MKVCVIGGGLSGLSVARYLKREPSVSEIVVYEASSQIGGAWVYTDRIGTDEYGAPIYTSMYKHLKANIPKQTMEVSGYHWPESAKTFVGSEEILQYIQSIAEREDLNKYVKFHMGITKVTRKENLWEVRAKNYKNKSEITKNFDAVFVCTGHNSRPNVPQIPGIDLFEGEKIHSHDYRIPDVYKDKKVLILGIGPSGEDISRDLVEFADKVYLSHHSKKVNTLTFPPKVVFKPDVKEFTSNGVIFEDGTEETVESIILCTGYDYYFPFLDESCGLDLSKHRVHPLYKHVINVNHPSLFFINMVGRLAPFIEADAQARYAVKAAVGGFNLPSKDAMIQSIRDEIEDKKNRGILDKHFHTMGYRELDYFEDLSAEAATERVPKVSVAIHVYIMGTKMASPKYYRKYVYTVTNNCTFTKELPEDDFIETLMVDNCK